MSIKKVEFQGKGYPEFITKGNHSRFIRPVAQEVLTGCGFDVGCTKPTWKIFPNDPSCVGVDRNRYYVTREVERDVFHQEEIEYERGGADNLPYYFTGGLNYIFSSHCLEHLPDYMSILRYWVKDRLCSSGKLFLYLPHSDCEYWRPWKMPTQRHIHQFFPEQMREIFIELGLTNVFASECDAAYSFCVYGEKRCST